MSGQPRYARRPWWRVMTMLMLVVGGKGPGREPRLQGQTRLRRRATACRRPHWIWQVATVVAFALVPVAAVAANPAAAQAASIVGTNAPTPAGPLRILSTSMQAVPQAPGDWPVGGNPCYLASSGYTTWCNMQLVIAIGNSLGVLTDEITVRITVNPGASKSKVSYTSIYSPNGGHFSQVHIDTYGLCYISREVCSDEIDGINPNSSSTLYPLTPSMRGHQAGLAFTLSGYCAICTGYKYATYSRRTGMTTCNRTNNNCYYPK